MACRHKWELISNKLDHLFDIRYTTEWCGECGMLKKSKIRLEEPEPNTVTKYIKHGGN